MVRENSNQGFLTPCHENTEIQGYLEAEMSNSMSLNLILRRDYNSSHFGCSRLFSKIHRNNLLLAKDQNLVTSLSPFSLCLECPSHIPHFVNTFSSFESQFDDRDDGLKNLRSNRPEFESS